MGWREQAELYRADDRQVIASGLPKMNIVEPQTTPTGATIWLHTNKVPLQMPNGEVLGMLGVYEDISERKRMEEALRASLAEKEVLLREIHHRVKNNLQIVISLLSMQSRAMKEPRVQEMLKDCQARVHSMALVHEALYRSGNLVQINLDEYLRSLGKTIMSSYSSGRTIKFMAELEPIQTNVETAIPCGLIVAELLSNALKYAFPDNRAGEILLSLRKNVADQIVLTIRDNGVGIPADLDLASVGSLGLKLVTDLAQFQLGGKMLLKKDPGTEIEIIVPFGEWEKNPRL
jgi:two-component sensor histidine kinase